jgi:hypothetical protein
MLLAREIRAASHINAAEMGTSFGAVEIRLHDSIYWGLSFGHIDNVVVLRQVVESSSHGGGFKPSRLYSTVIVNVPVVERKRLSRSYSAWQEKGCQFLVLRQHARTR